MNFEPVIFGIVTFIIIGVFHPIVIKAEYYFSYKIWPLFAAAGLALMAVTLFMDGLPAYILAILGITNLWCIIELFHQKKRVEKGWFPKNPRR
ncbi:MAG: DUF4491 family protein [Spirochaetia bacterium]|nr:DUF4491 family protein [Spirochaetia bacterium]MBQ3712665.1 DUF4491 family protein [Spirochaetia bacterium]MBQ6673587.1 DUF4491 family protein [Spirochaetia bacterium]